MRTIVVSSHRLADRMFYKADLLAGLVERGEVVLLYAGESVREYWHEVRRRRPAEIAGKFASAVRPRSLSVRAETSTLLTGVAAELGVGVESVRALDHLDCLRLVDSVQPDVVFNVSSLFVPERFLAACGGRVVGAHYAELPRFRGSDTIRWSVLLDAPIVVSHMFLRKELDMGDVLHRIPVSVERGDQIRHLRQKCQNASAAGHLAIADALISGTLSVEPQAEQYGSMFFRMGAFLSGKVDAILREQRYSHFDGGQG